MNEKNKLLVLLLCAALFVIVILGLFGGVFSKDATASDGYDFIEVKKGGFNYLNNEWRLCYFEKTKVLYYMEMSTRSLTMLTDSEGDPLIWVGE